MQAQTLEQLQTTIQAMVKPPADQLQQFSQLFKQSELISGQHFIREGDESRFIGFLNQGLLRMYYCSEEGKEFNKAFITENGFFAAYSAFLIGAPSRLYIQALEDCSLLLAPINKLRAFFNLDSSWNSLGRLLAEQLYIKKEKREAEFLLDDAAQRYANFQQEYSGLEDRIPQYHIASYLGITAVALSRIRNKPLT